jgi:hypothetical protein
MFRFTIRDLALLTVVAALGLGWSLDRARLLERIDELDGCQTIEEFLAREAGSFQTASPLP